MLHLWPDFDITSYKLQDVTIPMLSMNISVIGSCFRGL